MVQCDPWPTLGQPSLDLMISAPEAIPRFWALKDLCESHKGMAVCARATER